MIQMTVQEILDTYGNIVIPNRILIQLGIKEEDVLLNAEEVKKVYAFFSALCCD